MAQKIDEVSVVPLSSSTHPLPPDISEILTGLLSRQNRKIDMGHDSSFSCLIDDIKAFASVDLYSR